MKTVELNQRRKGAKENGRYKEKEWGRKEELLQSDGNAKISQEQYYYYIR